MIYCESCSDAKIVKDLKGTKSVILVGCPGCANSCLYLRNAPADSAMMTLSLNGFNAVSMQSEMDRLEHLLSGKGLKVGSSMGKYPTGILCIPDKRGRDKIIKNCKDYDTIITLSCDGGTKSVSKILKGKKIIPAMKAGGIMSALMKSKRLFTRLSIDKDSVDIVKFTIGN
jgi:hypothetical protein